MKALRVLLAIAAILTAGFAGGYGYGRWYGPKGNGEREHRHAERKVLYWQDGMHPWVKSEKPGKCPICNMDLDPVYEESAQSAAPAPQGKILHYTDPQDRNYKADAPGVNPETGNDLVPVYENSLEAMPEGTVQISAEKRQLIGVVFGRPAYAELHEVVRATGKVTIDERRISRVNPKAGGWIKTVYADFTGDLVRKGQPLVTLYSPELLASQREYLIARRSVEMLAKSSLADTQAQQRTMLEAARRRLELFDLTPGQIAELERTRQPVESVTIYAPASGYVIERNAFPNQRVMPDTSLYTLADLSSVWVMAEVFEQEAPNIRPGRAVTLSFPHAADRAIRGRVAYIQPGVDPATRTLQVRIEVPNPGLRLKPEMYLDVSFERSGGRMLAVPATAVLDTGRRQTVFVHRGEGFLEPRQVRIGRRFGEQVEVLDGLLETDEIVISGNFLVDSESQLQSGIRGAGGEAAIPAAGGGRP